MPFLIRKYLVLPNFHVNFRLKSLSAKEFNFVFVKIALLNWSKSY